MLSALSLLSFFFLSYGARQTVLTPFLFSLETKKRQLYLLEQRSIRFLVGSMLARYFGKLEESVQWSVLFRVSDYRNTYFMDHAFIACFLSPELIWSASKTCSRKRAWKKRRRQIMQTVCGILFLLLYSFRHRIFASGSNLWFPMIGYRATCGTLDRALSCFPFPDSNEQPIWTRLIDFRCRFLPFTGYRSNSWNVDQQENGGICTRARQ